MNKRDFFVMIGILVGVSIPVGFIALLANGTIKIMPSQ